MDEVKQVQDNNLNQVPTPEMPKSHKGYLLAIAGLVLLVIVLGAGLILKKPNPTSTALINTPVTPTPIQTPIPLEKPIIFIRNRELWSRDPAGSEKQITQTGSLITAFQASLDGKWVAYITGRKNTLENGYVLVEPVSVQIQALASNTPTTIFELAPSTISNQEYVNQIRDLAFSNDNKQLAITTSQSLWLYDISSNTKKQVFDFPPDQDKDMIYSYGTPIFSPANDQILLNIGYYEGSSSGVVDVASGKLTKLPFTSYVSGTRPLGWTDNQHLLISEYDDSTSVGSTSILYTIPASDPTAKTIILTLPGTVYSGAIAGNVIYLVQSIMVNGQIINGAQTTYDNIYLLQFKLTDTSTKKILSFEGVTHPSISKIISHDGMALADVVTYIPGSSSSSLSHSLFLNEQKITEGELVTY